MLTNELTILLYDVFFSDTDLLMQYSKKKAKKDWATRDEVISAVSMNLHLTGLSNVLECLPSVIEGYEID